MKIYQGFRRGNIVCVYVDEVELNPSISQKVRDHATDFEWGYRGSGPTQLALALLIDCIEDTEEALNWYLYFRDEVVADMDLNGWVLLDSQILDWYYEKKNNYDKNTPPEGYSGPWFV